MFFYFKHFYPRVDCKKFLLSNKLILTLHSGFSVLMWNKMH